MHVFAVESVSVIYGLLEGAKLKCSIPRLAMDSQVGYAVGFRIFECMSDTNKRCEGKKYIFLFQSCSFIPAIIYVGDNG